MRKPDLSKNPRLRFALLVLYYFAIIVVLLILYGRSGFSTPPFVYQGF
jgi:D-Ala-teichoic acid biosynthesis protein